MRTIASASKTAPNAPTGPDFLIRIRDSASSGPEDLLTLILEVTGWAFLEVTDPWDAEHLIRAKRLEPAEVRA